MQRLILNLIHREIADKRERIHIRYLVDCREKLSLSTLNRYKFLGIMRTLQ
jgi:hypothetical protein